MRPVSEQMEVIRRGAVEILVDSELQAKIIKASEEGRTLTIKPDSTRLHRICISATRC